MLCFAVSQNPSCPVLCVVSKPGCCGSRACTARGTNPTLNRCEPGAAAAPVSVGEALLLFSNRGNDQGKDLYVCVCFAPEIIKVSVLWGDGAGYSDGSAVGLLRGFAATSKGGRRVVAVGAGGGGRRAAPGTTPGNSTWDSCPTAAIFPGAPALPSVHRAPAR